MFGELNHTVHPKEYVALLHDHPSWVRPMGYLSHLDKFGISKMAHTANAERLDVLDFLTAWLNHTNPPYAVLLGEYGMGKTTACRYLTHTLLEQRREDPSMPLPIYLDLRHLKNKHKSHELTVLAIIESCLSAEEADHNPYLLFSASDVLRLVREEGALVILDGLDEVLVHLSLSEGQQFARKLWSILPPSVSDMPHIGRSGHLLFTCRTHYFRTLRDQKSFLLAEDRAGLHADDYHIVMMHPFKEIQIQEYLVHAMPHVDVASIMRLIHSVHNLYELAERPYILSLIPHLIPQMKQWSQEGIRVTNAMIYQQIVTASLRRDDDKHKLTIQHKQKIMEYFAAELWRSGKTTWTITHIEDWFIRFLYSNPMIAEHYIAEYGEEILYRMLDILKQDVRTATFLVRVGEDQFRFAHASLQEFFLANYLYHALLEKRYSHWSMPLVSVDTLHFLGQLLNQASQHKVAEYEVILGAFAELQSVYQKQASELVLAYRVLADVQGYPVPASTGMELNGALLKAWNIVGIPASYIEKRAEKMIDMQNSAWVGAHLEVAHLRCLDMSHSDFSEAHLAGAEFTDVRAQSVSFRNADLSGVFFKHVDLSGADFTGAKCHQTQWLQCDLEEVKGLEHVPLHAFSHCLPAESYEAPALGVPILSTKPLPYAHSHTVESCAFSRDGKWVLSASWDRSVRIWEAESWKCHATFSHDTLVRHAAFSPEGVRIAVVSGDTSIKIWDIDTARCVQTLSGHTDWVRYCAFSSDGTKLISASEDHTMRLWDPLTGDCQRILSGHTDWVRACAFSPRGDRLVSVSEDQTVRVWDAENGECLFILRGHTDWVRSCSFSRHGQFLVSGSGDGTLRIWDVYTGECLHTFNNYNSRVRTCAFSPDDRWVAAGSDDGIVRIWDVESEECVRHLVGHEGKVRGCHFSPDGQSLISSAEDQSIRVWSASTGICTRVF